MGRTGKMKIQDSEVLKDKTMQRVKQSLENISSIDNQEEFRVDMLEYINYSSYNNNDMFFYDMMEFIRFLKPDDDSVAYTTPEHLIYLNSPGKIGKNKRQWDFIYDHECMHQLWETFGVEDKIKDELGKCDRMLLNIASDCVINDYLDHYRKKEMPDNLITPDYLEERYGVIYDRKIDTQYTLYKKLLEVQEKLKKDLEKLKKMLGDPDQNGEGDGDGDSDPNGVDGGSSSNKDQKGKSGKGNDSKDSGEDGEGSGKDGKNPGGNRPDVPGPDGVPGNPPEGDGPVGKGSGKDGKKSSDDPEKDGKNPGGDKPGDNGYKKDGEKPGGKSPIGGNGKGSIDQLAEDLDKIRKDAEEIINSYAKKISGVFGDFVTKCKSSQKCQNSGLEVKVQKGNSTWNQDMSRYINAYVKNKIFKKKRQWMSTYSKVRRGAEPMVFGQPLLPGRKIIEESMDINCAFYVDKSGSMDGSIKDVYNAVYRLADAMKKQFSREQVVKGIDFDIYAFDTSIVKVKFGNSTKADGGTMSFDDLLGHIDDKSKDYMINVIITDAGFGGIDESKVEKFIDGLGGIILFITNVDNDQIKNMAKKKEGKLYYILADSKFTVGN